MNSSERAASPHPPPRHPASTPTAAHRSVFIINSAILFVFVFSVLGRQGLRSYVGPCDGGHVVTLVKQSHTQGLRILICRTGSITPSFEVCVRITGHKHLWCFVILPPTPTLPNRLEGRCKHSLHSGGERVTSKRNEKRKYILKISTKEKNSAKKVGRKHVLGEFTLQTHFFGFSQRCFR